MTTLTWKGEDDLHQGGQGPRFNTWNGINFEVGKPVDLDDTALKPEEKASMIAKAKRNAYFDVSVGSDEDLPGRNVAVAYYTAAQVEKERRGPGRPPKPREGE